jgi:uncharacterized protein YggT (Ycf19 family)
MGLYICAFCLYAILGSIKSTKDKVFTRFLGKISRPVIAIINKFIPNIELWGAGIVGFVALVMLFWLINLMLFWLINCILGILGLSSGSAIYSSVAEHGSAIGHAISNSGTTFK